MKRMTQVIEIWDEQERKEIEWLLIAYCCFRLLCVVAFGNLASLDGAVGYQTHWHKLSNILGISSAYMLSRLARLSTVQTWRKVGFIFVTAGFILMELPLIVLIWKEFCYVDVSDHVEAINGFASDRATYPFCANMYHLRIFPPFYLTCSNTMLIMAVLLFRLHWMKILMLAVFQLIIFATITSAIWPSTPLERNNMGLTLVGMLQFSGMAIVYQRGWARARMHEHEKARQELHMRKCNSNEEARHYLMFPGPNTWDKQEQREIEILMFVYSGLALLALLLSTLDGAPLRFIICNLLGCSMLYKLSCRVKQVTLRLWQHTGFPAIMVWVIMLWIKLVVMLMDEVCMQIGGDGVEADVAYPICANMYGLRTFPPRLHVILINLVLMAAFMFHLEWKHTLVIVTIQMAVFATVAFALWPSTQLELINLQYEFMNLVHVDMFAVLNSYQRREIK